MLLRMEKITSDEHGRPKVFSLVSIVESISIICERLTLTGLSPSAEQFYILLS